MTPVISGISVIVNYATTGGVEVAALKLYLYFMLMLKGLLFGLYTFFVKHPLKIRPLF